MSLSCYLFACSALMWPLRRICKAKGILLPFLSVLTCCAAVTAGLYDQWPLRQISAGVLIVMLCAFSMPGRGEKS